MTELKCPLCGQELECCGTYIDGTKKLWCDNCKLFGDNRLFEKLIRTRKELDDLQKDYDLAIQHAKTMTETCLGYKAKLDTARSAVKYIADGNLGLSPVIQDFAEKLLEQIKDNDKDVK